MDGLVDLSIVVKSEEAELPEGVNALELLQMVYQGKVKVSPQQMRAAIEALPFESAKLTAIANVNYNFAIELDRKIEERSQRSMKLIEAQPVETKHPPVELKPFSRLRRV